MSNSIVAKFFNFTMLLIVLLILSIGFQVVQSQNSKSSTLMVQLNSPINIQSQQHYFQNVTYSVGINTSHEHVGYMITGQAFGDVNNDDYLDIFLTRQDGSNDLYINDKQGAFIRASYNDQIALNSTISTGAVFGDYDNDGWVDLFVMGQGANTLFRNLEGLGFEDVTEYAHVEDNGSGRSAAWGDYDNDGLLDLYVTNWKCDSCDGGNFFVGNTDRFYHNLGNGTFEDVNYLLTAERLRGAGHAVSFVDIDEDGDLDIYVVNDAWSNPIGNVMWKNDGEGCGGWCFSDFSDSSLLNIVLNGMSLATGDYDNDLDLDFYFSNIGKQYLMENRNGWFADVGRNAGVSMQQRDVGWGSGFFDFNNDMYQDLFVSLTNFTFETYDRSVLFMNNQDGTFLDLGYDAGINTRSMGMAYGDYDNDGQVDVLLGQFSGEYLLYKNQFREVMNSTAKWISFKLLGGNGINKDAIGTRVYLTLSDGTKLMKEVKSGSSFGAGSDTRLHFGLANNDISLIEIRWSNGQWSVFDSISSNSFVYVQYNPNGSQLGLDRNNFNVVEITTDEVSSNIDKTSNSALLNTDNSMNRTNTNENSLIIPLSSIFISIIIIAKKRQIK